MREIDFELLKYADFEVINSDPTPEEFKVISAFLQADLANQRPPSAPLKKSARPLPAMRKSVKPAIQLNKND